MHFHSHIPIQNNLRVFKTLMDMCHSVVTESDDRVKKEAHIKEALKRCGYPEWSSRKVQEKARLSSKKKPSEDRENSKGVTVLPYVSGVSEPLQHVLKRHVTNRIAQECA